MKPSFNLVTEGWIPCVDANGNIQELNLLDTFRRADEIVEILDTSSPLATASLHRLLLAILYRNVNLDSFSDWKTLWRNGWDNQQIEDYFNQWHHRFDLFNDERPFYQTPGMPEHMLGSAGKLTYNVSSGGNRILFDHSSEETVVPFTPQQAARLLVAFQAFATGGIHTYEKGRSYAVHAPLVDGAIIIPIGNNLRETLLLNLVIYHQQGSRVFFAKNPDDRPTWEQDEPAKIAERLPLGYLDYLTWQSRRIWLKPEFDGDNLCVRKAIVADGLRFPKTATVFDPMMVYNRDEPKPHRLRADKAYWRNSMALLESMLTNNKCSRVLEHIGQMIYQGVLPSDAIYNVNVFGVITKQAEVLSWQHEQQPLPLRYLSDNDLVGELRDCCEMVKEIDSALYGALKTACETFTSTKDEFANILDRSLYWSLLETRFMEMAVQLTQGDVAAIKKQWAQYIQIVANKTFNTNLQHWGMDANALHARAVGYRRLRSAFHKTLKPYQEAE